MWGDLMWSPKDVLPESHAKKRAHHTRNTCIQSRLTNTKSSLKRIKWYVGLESLLLNKAMNSILEKSCQLCHLIKQLLSLSFTSEFYNFGKCPSQGKKGNVQAAGNLHVLNFYLVFFSVHTVNHPWVHPLKPQSTLPQTAGTGLTWSQLACNARQHNQ